MMSNNEFIFFKSDMVVNWNDHGMLLKDCLISQLNINQSINNEIVYPRFGGKMIETPLPQNIEIELSMVCRDMITKNEKYDFKDVLENDLEIEDLFKIINKKIEKGK